MRLESALRAGLDLLFPRRCILTDATTIKAPLQYISEPGLREVLWADEPACQSCGIPFYGLSAHEKKCPDCKDRSFSFQRGKTLFLMNSAGRKIIHALKYKEGSYLLKDLAHIIHSKSHYLAFLEDTVLVPVPLHARKERERGYNQSLWIAQTLAAQANNCEVVNLLKRDADTPSQTQFSRTQRLKNVKGAFSLRGKPCLSKNRRHIIVDDVFTTGSTLNECALVLAASGIQKVDIITLGHG